MKKPARSLTVKEKICGYEPVAIDVPTPSGNDNSANTMDASASHPTRLVALGGGAYASGGAGTSPSLTTLPSPADSSPAPSVADSDAAPLQSRASSPGRRRGPGRQ